MISHKVLIILTVIFGSIICLKGIFTDSDDSVDLKDYLEPEEYKDYLDFLKTLDSVDSKDKELNKCKNILNKIGFKSDCGIYNILFILQFLVESNSSQSKMKLLDIMQINFEKANYDNATLSDETSPQKSDTSVESTSTKNHDEEKETNNILKFLTGIHDEVIEQKNNIDKFLWTPEDFCKRLIKKKNNRTTASQEKISRFIGYATSNFTKYFTNKDIQRDIQVKEGDIQGDIQVKEGDIQVTGGDIQAIEECKKSIVEYELKKGDKTYIKYDGNNGFKCFLTSFDINEKKIFKDMKDEVQEYFNYHLNFDKKFKNWFEMYTGTRLCKHYILKKRNKYKKSQDTIQNE